MKASDYMNQKPTEKIPKLTRTFTGDHFVTIIKSLVGLGIVYLLITFAKWGIESAIKFQTTPIPPTQGQVDTAVAKVIKADTLVISKQVEYKYEDSFKTTKDTTYWFFTGNLTGPDNYHWNSRVIKMPYSFFNFYEAAEFLKRGNKKAKDAYIEDFIQISKASYISYRKYADAN